jgi:hypothetical protein
MANFENFGDILCDMHDGLNLDRLGGESAARLLRLIEIESEHGDEFIKKTVSAKTGQPYKYTNKHAVLIGEGARGCLQFAYSIDGRKLGLFDVQIN